MNENEIVQNFVELLDNGSIRLFRSNDETEFFAVYENQWYLLNEELKNYIETNYDIGRLN